MNFILNVKVLTDMYFDYFKGPIESYGDPVEFVREAIEHSLGLLELDKIKGQINPSIIIPVFYTGSLLTKRHSTNGDLTSLTSDDLHGECYADSYLLRQIVIFYHGLDTTIVRSNFISPYKKEAFQHHYLSAAIGANEIIIEPTLGQFLLNYRGIFVGTRQELYNLFITTLKNCPTQFSPQWSWYRELLMETPERRFEVIWGERSVEA